MRNFFQRLMYGRYGIDKLNGALLWGWLIAMLLYRMLRWRMIYWIAMILFCAMFLRMMSRNTWQRQKENERFVAKLQSVQASVHFQIRRIKDIRHYRYRACPHCRSMLRLPRRRGTHTVCCPRCHEDFSVTIRL